MFNSKIIPRVYRKHVNLTSLAKWDFNNLDSGTADSLNSAAKYDTLIIARSILNSFLNVTHFIFYEIIIIITICRAQTR